MPRWLKKPKQISSWQKQPPYVWINHQRSVLYGWGQAERRQGNRSTNCSNDGNKYCCLKIIQDTWCYIKHVWSEQKNLSQNLHQGRFPPKRKKTDEKKWNCNEWLVRGESRSTCSFIKTKRRSNRQISSSGIEGNVDKAESKSEAEQWVRAGGRQRGLPVNQAGSERQAANDQERESNSPGSTREDKLGKTLGNVSQGKTRLRTGWVFVCCFYVSEWMRCRCGEANRVDEWMVTAVWLV